MRSTRYAGCSGNYQFTSTEGLNLQGPIADSLIKKIQSTGGIMTQKDFASYSVIVEPALNGTFMGRKVYTTHAPASGPVLLHMLNMLEQYDLTDEGRTGLNTHRIVEVMKCKFIRSCGFADYLLTRYLISSLQLALLQGLSDIVSYGCLF